MATMRPLLTPGSKIEQTMSHRMPRLGPDGRDLVISLIKSNFSIPVSGLSSSSSSVLTFADLICVRFLVLLSEPEFLFLLELMIF